MPKARVSGLGVVPGVSSQEAAHVIAGECAEAPFVPLLPSRGPGADPIGRTGAIIAIISSDFAIETVPTGWRLTSVPGRDISRGQGFLSSDLDAMEEQFHQADSTLTISITGPVTWAASVEDPRGEKLIRDHGALREVTSALANSIAELGEQLRRTDDEHRAQHRWMDTGRHLDDGVLDRGRALDLRRVVVDAGLVGVLAGDLADEVGVPAREPRLVAGRGPARRGA